MRKWKNVATLVKAKGLNGRFVACPAAGLPFILDVGCEVAFVPPKTDAPRAGTVDFVREIDVATYEVGFDSVPDYPTACELAGCSCLVERDSIDDAIFQEEPVTWVGWRIVDASAGDIGQVASLIDNPGQALLDVPRRDGSMSYIPVVEEFLCGIDVEKQVITVDLPAGLLDL